MGAGIVYNNMIGENMSLQNVNESDFSKEVLSSTGLVLVDFWAAWCGPCRAVAPLLELLQEKNKEKIKVVKVDVDSNNELSSQHNVSSIPALLFFKDGKRVGELIGVQKESVLQDKINELA